MKKIALDLSRRRGLLAFLFLPLFLLLGCNAQQRGNLHSLKDVSLPDSDGYSTCTYGGINRKFILYAPKEREEYKAILLLLHGYGNSAKGFMDFIKINDCSDAASFILIYPQGIRYPKDRTSGAGWNFDTIKDGNNDVGFLTALACYAQKEFSLPANKTFVAGFSNGAFMTYTLAASAPSTFKAIASVAGTMGGGAWDKRKKKTSMGILQINGTKDDLVPRSPDRAVFGNAPPIDGVIEYWENANGLDVFSSKSISPRVEAYMYSSEKKKDRVWHIEIEDYPHSWPMKSDSAGFSANKVIIEFFSLYLD